MDLLIRKITESFFIAKMHFERKKKVCVKSSLDKLCHSSLPLDIVDIVTEINKE